MVVILTSGDVRAASSVARALSAALGWPRGEARDPRVLHATIAEVLGRREHFVVATPIFSPGEQAIVRGELHNVRFIEVTGDADPDAVVRRIGYDFGLI